MLILSKLNKLGERKICHHVYISKVLDEFVYVLFSFLKLNNSSSNV